MTRSSKFREHIRSNLIGYLALFIALTIAPAWAASIGADDIKRNAVRSKHIKNGQVKKNDLTRSLRTRTEFARVKSDGTLESGTATSALRISPGFYRLDFPRPISRCAGAASPAGFPGDPEGGARTSVLKIGLENLTNAPAPKRVHVVLFDDFPEDSPFTLVLACP